jgi:hypothetical protein
MVARSSEHALEAGCFGDDLAPHVEIMHELATRESLMSIRYERP